MKIITISILCLLALNVVASQKAITEEGDVVVLNDDGSWFYENGQVAISEELEVNSTTFSRPNNATFMLKSTKTNSAFWINPRKWKFEKNDNGHDAAEYTLNVKGSDLYGLIISEQLEIAVEELAKIALDNARGAAPDAKIIKKEYRMVNGNKVIYMEMEGTIQSIKFTYFGYYFSNSTGSTQFLAYTGSSLVKKYRADIDNLLNGFSSRG